MTPSSPMRRFMLVEPLPRAYVEKAAIRVSFRFIETLQGAEEVRQHGKVSVYRLLGHVTQRVIEGSRQLGKLQQPCLRGTIDGELTWPIFRPGSLFHAAFPERGHAPVSRDIQRLSAYGFPPKLLKACAGAISGLLPVGLTGVNSIDLFCKPQ